MFRWLLRHWLITGVGVLLVICCGAAYFEFRARKKAAGSSKDVPAIATVRKGPMRITLTVEGKVISKDSEVITHKIESRGRMTIKEIVPEGTFAKKGQVLVRLDDTELTRDLDKLKSEQRNVKNEVEVAETELEILKRESQSALESDKINLACAGSP